MSDRIRQVIAYIVAMMLVAAFVAVPTVARTTDPGVDQVVLAAQGTGNADMVDGRDAVKFTENRDRRAGKLVATNHKGYLPSNIVKPYWGNIKNMPGGFADGTDDKGVVKLQVRIVESSTRTLSPGESGSIKASCAQHYYVVGGGYYGPDALAVYKSYPSDSRSWRVAAENTAASSDVDLTAFAVCLIARPRDLITN